MNEDLVEVIHHRQFHYAEDQLKAYSVFARKLSLYSVKQRWLKLSLDDARFTSKATY
jgi:hypothetical protein